MNPRTGTAAAMLSLLRERGLDLAWLATEIDVPLPVLRRVASGDVAVRFADFRKIRCWVEMKTEKPGVVKLPVSPEVRAARAEAARKAKPAPKPPGRPSHTDAIWTLQQRVANLETELGIIKARLFYPEKESPCSP